MYIGQSIRAMKRDSYYYITCFRVYPCRIHNGGHGQVSIKVLDAKCRDHESNQKDHRHSSYEQTKEERKKKKGHKMKYRGK